ncbi:HWE histidine kinase domain-containing protein [Paracoccus actinidiae]
MAGEISHRFKNLLAIALGLTRITSRSSHSIEDMTNQAADDPAHSVGPGA